MGYDFEYVMPEMSEGLIMGAAGMVLALFAVCMVFALAVGVLKYVLTAISLYRIAKRRGIHRPWLAWIPVAGDWLLGSISDHYQYVTKRKVTHRRTLILVLSIAVMIISATSLVIQISNLTAVFSSAFAAATAAPSIGAAVGTMLLGLVSSGLSIALLVFYYMSYYDLFRSCKPNNAVMFLVLGIIFGITLPFFAIACSKSDEGMPEKRAPQPDAPQLIPQPEEVPAEADPVQEEAPAEEEVPQSPEEPTEE